MHTNILTVTEAVRHFSEYLNRIAYKHERFVLVKGRKPIAELRPLPSGRILADLPELLASLPSLSKKESATFSADITNARESISKEGLKDPRES